MKQSSPWFSEEQGDQQSDEHETEMDNTHKLLGVSPSLDTPVAHPQTAPKGVVPHFRVG